MDGSLSIQSFNIETSLDEVQLLYIFAVNLFVANRACVHFSRTF